MTLIDHARRELDLASLGDDDADYGGMLKNAVLQLVEVFADQGHSGASAAMVTDIVQRLMRYETLTPLTGEDSEWNDVAEIGGGSGQIMYQNNRLSHVFKDGSNGAYTIDGIVLVDPRGGAWMGPRVYIDFPYTHEQKVYRIDSHGRPIGDHPYEKPGFCEDDDCQCWTGGPELILPGDPGWSEEAEANRLAAES
ncbi:MAG: hypothetical protein JWR85_4062 [Marmoricola sp.]|nr:hypothetical protein [Marmoricola sp.]